MEPWLERSILPEREVAPEVAFDFHLDTFARWLRAAGAESRLAVVFVSGPRARHRLGEGLSARGCRVTWAGATPGAPVHPALAAHQGDHFNDTLFLVDGLETEEPGRLLRAIGLQIAQYRRLATWVGVLVESPTALAALEADGGILRRHAQRRFVFLDAEDPAAPADPVPGQVVTGWGEAHRIAERAFHTSMTANVAPTALDFGRLARTGYAGLPTTAATHPELRALRRLLAHPPRSEGEAAEFIAHPSETTAEVLGRVAPSVLAWPTVRMSLAVALAAEPAARYAIGLPVADGGPLGVLALVRDALDAGRAPSAGAVAALEAVDLDAEPHLGIHVDLLRAAAAIALEDFGACDAALARADARLGAGGLSVAPELAFEVVEKRTGFFAAVGERGQARAGLDRLAELLPRLHSPFYEARHLLARGEQMLPLDPGRARDALRDAGMLFHTHGYDRWAATARSAAEG